MSIAKLLLATAIAAAPIGVVSGQSGAPADTGSDHNARGWIAGAGAVAGAGLFMAFTHSGHNSAATGSNFNLHAATTPGAHDPAPTGGTTPPSPADTTSTPPDTGTVTHQPGPQNNPPLNDGSNPPPNDTSNAPTGETPPPNRDAGLVPDASTVPEPGSAALLLTGIVGLAPLLRNRRK